MAFNAGESSSTSTVSVASASAGDLGKLEDAAHASGDAGTQVLAVRKATPANLSGTDGDYEPLQVDGGHLWTRAKVSSGLTTTQNALSTTAEEVLAANSVRVFASVRNADAAINMYIGDDNTVSAINGHLLPPGVERDFGGYTGAVWMIAASGTPTVTTIEW